MKIPNNDGPATLERLLEKLLDGSISESEHSDLECLLLGSPEAQEAYYKRLDLDTDLRAMNFGDVFDLPTEPAKTRGTGYPTPLWSSKMVAGMALATSLLIVFSFAWRAMNPNVPAETQRDAILVQSAGGQFFRDPMPLAGQPLQSRHTYALTKGLIDLKFRNGAEVILEAPAVLEILNGDRLMVRQGVCSVHAPPGAEGFRVVTPQTEVVDLGTRFSVAVTEGGDTEVQVVEGAAEIFKLNASKEKALLLKESQASRSSGGQLLPIDFSDQQYRRDLPDRIISFAMANADADSSGRLESVLVQRGGARVEYKAEEIIGVEVTHFRGGKSSQHLSVTVGEEVDTERIRRDLLESDRLLHTGILNMGGSDSPLIHDPVLHSAVADAKKTTPGMAIRFRKPVVNDAGPDIVFFELQSVVNPPDGDAFHVSPIRFEPALKSITIRRYDITLNSIEAVPIPSFDLFQSAQPAGSLEELLTGTYTKRKSSIPFFAIAVGIDLSDLGYPDGATISELFFQDAADDIEHEVDPVFIGGLPTRSHNVKVNVPK